MLQVSVVNQLAKMHKENVLLGGFRQVNLFLNNLEPTKWLISTLVEYLEWTSTQRTIAMKWMMPIDTWGLFKLVPSKEGT
jgi:hypothetical protein